MRRELLIGAAAVLAVALVFQLYWQGGNAQIEAGRQAYQAHCSSCHGKKLEGQANWQTPLPSGRMPAPPHDASGHSWHHADKDLIGITKFGLKPYVGENYESDMPAFEGKLSDDDIAAIWVFIKSTWPQRERDYQEQITRQAGATGQN